MHTVTIADPAYDIAQQRAKAHGVSVAAYIETAIKAIAEAEQTDELDRPLAAAQLDRIEESRQQIQRGEFKTVEQVKAALISKA